MIRPRDVDGYIAPQNRVWSGTVNEIETQYRTAASTATRGWPTKRERDQRERADHAQDRELLRRARADASGEGAQEVRDERRRRERGDAQRDEAALPRDRGQQRADDRAGDPDAHRAHEVERQVPAHGGRTGRTTTVHARLDWAGHHMPRTIREACEVSCRAGPGGIRRAIGPRGRSAIRPGEGGSPALIRGSARPSSLAPRDGPRAWEERHGSLVLNRSA